jgi:hypothetical protein
MRAATVKVSVTMDATRFENDMKTTKMRLVHG